MGEAGVVRLGRREIEALVELMRETKLYEVLDYYARKRGARLEELLTPERIGEFRELVVELTSEGVYEFLVRTAMKRLKRKQL